MPALACPRCTAALNKQADGKLACAGCRVSFPFLGEGEWAVPLLWADPGSALLDWRNRFNAALADLETQLQACSPSADTTAPATRTRLQHLYTALTHYQQELQTLLAPLRVGDALASETHMALRTRLLSHHGILSYAQNIHRDWCWGEAENQQVCAHLQKVLAAAGVSAAGQQLLILGGGAGRLGYDLQQALACAGTWVLDVNPLLCLIGSRVVAGEQLSLTEFPLAPIGLEDAAVARTLRAPSVTHDVHFVCADALSPPFAPGSFDVLVTPWLLDVLDAGVDETLRNIHRLLKPGGVWLQHGSVAFDRGAPEQRLTAVELGEMTAAAGFEVVHADDTEFPYMQSPASRQQRRELVYTQLACRDDSPPAAEHDVHQHLPAWIASSTLPIPLSRAFQTQITTVRIHAFIMSLIDGKRSIRDMAQVLEAQRLMPANQAEAAIRGFLTTMYEEAVHRDGFVKD